MKKYKKRIFILVLFLALVCVGVAAITMNDLPAIKMSVFSQQFQSADFSITNVNMNLRGKTQIRLILSLQNNDAQTHSANVTVQLIDNSGAIITEAWQLTGNVNGGNTVRLSYNIPVNTTLVSSAQYIIEQLS
jgi:hypothetical protein